MRPSPPSAVVVFLAGACVALSAAAQLQPLFRASQDLVVVDVAVLDKSGNPLLNLERDDFVVTVDDRPRRVQSVRLVLTDPARAGLLLEKPTPVQPEPSSLS